MSELNHTLRHGVSSWAENPVLVHGLGLSPLLALSNSFDTAVALLFCFGLLVLTGSVVYPMIRRHTGETWRVAVLIIMLSALATVIGLALSRFVPDLQDRLGIYLPLLCCNFAVIVHIVSLREASRINAILMPSLAMIAGYGVVLLAFAALREYLAGGSLQFGFADTQAGGFLLLGLLLAIFNAARNRFTSPNRAMNQEIEPAPRARVTEKLQ